MSDESIEGTVEPEIEYQSFAEFLEGTPPNQLTHISDLSDWEFHYNSTRNVLQQPEIQLHCENENCNGVRFFRCTTEKEALTKKRYEFTYVKYCCWNCQKTEKVFALAARVDEDKEKKGLCYKFGEMPTYGPPVSPKLIKLIGPDRDEFLKGRTCENQGLGVGSFIYYRRVVENQKDRIIGRIIEVAERIGAAPERISTLKAAVAETQFTKALEMAKGAMPQSLLINGHSPIGLLHSALSKGVHALSDEQCLHLATSVRVVLGELSDRLSQAMKDEAELKKAIGVLVNKNRSAKN